MQLEIHVEQLRADLASLAALGDDAAARAAERLSGALGSALGLRLLDVLAEAALEVSAQLPSGHVEVRLAGKEPSLVYVESEDVPAPHAEDGLQARITLRLPESLKASVEAAAAREGVSVNAWLVRALLRAVSSSESPRGPGSRLTGFAQS